MFQGDCSHGQRHPAADKERDLDRWIGRRAGLLVVDGNRITCVGETDASMPPETPDDRVIDATGKFILPGLIDAHCHISLHQGALPGVRYASTAEFCTLWAAHAIGRVLRAGVTSIAVPGGKWFTDVTVREAVEGGLLEGPRMVVAGDALIAAAMAEKAAPYVHPRLAAEKHEVSGADGKPLLVPTGVPTPQVVIYLPDNGRDPDLIKPGTGSACES
jgi:imidazolonepropionase-like amidohydrolase